MENNSTEETRTLYDQWSRRYNRYRSATKQEALIKMALIEIESHEPVDDLSLMLVLWDLYGVYRQSGQLEQAAVICISTLPLIEQFFFPEEREYIFDHIRTLAKLNCWKEALEASKRVVRYYIDDYRTPGDRALEEALDLLSLTQAHHDDEEAKALLNHNFAPPAPPEYSKEYLVPENPYQPVDTTFHLIDQTGGPAEDRGFEQMEARLLTALIDYAAKESLTLAQLLELVGQGIELTMEVLFGADIDSNFNEPFLNQLPIQLRDDIFHSVWSRLASLPDEPDTSVADFEEAIAATYEQ